MIKYNFHVNFDFVVATVYVADVFNCFFFKKKNDSAVINLHSFIYDFTYTCVFYLFTLQTKTKDKKEGDEEQRPKFDGEG